MSLGAISQLEYYVAWILRFKKSIKHMTPYYNPSKGMVAGEMEKFQKCENTICASIVTYNPKIARLEQNILGIFNNGINSIIIVDNCSRNFDEVTALSDKLGKDKFTVISNRENMGIACALNQALDMANKKGYQWLLTLDQDSVCSSGYISAMSEYFCHSSIGLIYPKKIQDAGRSSLEKVKISKIQTYIHNYRKKKRKSILPMPITSGCLINVYASIKSGAFTDYLFIDSVDFDFNLKLFENNFTILECSEAILHHSLGNPTGHHFLGWHFIASGHPAWRFYYISRNAWLLKYNHIYGVPKKWCSKNLSDNLSLLRMLDIYISNNFNFSYIAYIIKGHYDGIFKKLRKHDEILKHI
jgi:rhamnosyltransferase